jgi:signal transduction histidine kinase
MGKETTRILLVEDEEAHADLVRRAFKSKLDQVSLMVVPNLQEAHARILDSEPDIVVTDLILPDGIGTQLLPAGSNTNSFPIVVMTSHGDEQVAVDAMKAGALDYIVKSEATLANMPFLVDRSLREWGNLIKRKQAEVEIKKLNLELEQQAEDRARELATLYEIMEVTSESLDMQTTLERSLERVLKATRCNVGAIQLLDETRAILNLAVQRGIPPTLLTSINNMTTSRGAVGRIVRDGQPLLTNDIVAELMMLGVPPVDDFPRSYVGVPVRARGQILGVLSVVGDQGRHFDRKEADMLASIADQVGIAVENTRLRQQARRVAVMEERARLARELHDSVTQSLYSATLFAEAARELATAGESEKVANYLSQLGQITQQSLKEMRLLVYELRPPALQSEGLLGALQQRMDAVEARSGVEARLMVEDLIELPANVEEGFYGIAQEALNNTLKHAAATSVKVRLGLQDRWIQLEIEDNGLGFNPDTTDSGGLGLTSMRERAGKVGGILTILSSPGEGTKIVVRVEMPESLITKEMR